MRNRRSRFARPPRRRRRRVMAGQSALMSALNLRRLGDDLHRISKYIADSASYADEQPEAMDIVDESTDTIRDLVYGIKTELEMWPE